MGESPSFLDGAPRLRERPVRELSRALERLGGVVSPVDEGPLDLPLRAGGTVLHGGSANLAADRSSQFASALLLMGSRLPGGLELRLDPPAVSLPYVDLTVEVLKAFGVQVVREAPLRWRVAEGSHRGCHYRVEGDHSSASYLLAAPAIVGGRTLVRGLRPGSAQPDSRLSEILMDCGCQVNSGEDWIEVRGDGRIMSLDLELGEAPDLVPTVAVLALFADGPSVLRGIAHLRHKESDRLGLLARNLRALGRPARAFEDRLEIGPRAGELRGAAILTASDHRIAMAFAIAGLRIPGIELDDADCVGKSNPEFWSQFRAFYG
jgi:3-phosphoshikimate 1-carboxyvinyltransferase